MKNSNSVVLKIFSIVFLPMTLAALVAVLAISYVTTQRYQEAYTERFETSWHSLAATLSTNVWTYDLKAIDATLDSYVRVWDVKAIQVIDQYGTLLNSIGTTSTDRNSNIRILPMYDDRMAKIGEVQLWLPSSGFLNEDYISNALRIAFVGGMLLLALCLIVFRALKKVVVSPLKKITNFQTSDNPTLNDDVDYPDELQSLVESIVSQKLTVENAVEALNEDLHSKSSLANSLQSLLSESDQTCLMLDDSENVLISNLSAPFSSKHLPMLTDIVGDVVDPIAGLTEAGFEVHRSFVGALGSEGKNFEIVASTGETLMVKIFRLQNSSRALVAHNVSHAKWSDLLIDELLGLSQSGLAIFDRAGRLQMEKGASVTRLLHNFKENVDVNLARILLEFPKIDVDANTGSVSFEHRLSDDRVYRVHFSQHEQSGIGITHHDITEERRVEKHLIESQRLNDLGRITSGVAHDFNNSLGVVIGQLELASCSDAPSKKTRHIQTALSAASQSANVVKQLMTYSRKQPQDPVVVSLDDIIYKQKNVFKSAVGGGVSIYYDLASDGIVSLDVELFTSAMLNILINASDAMEGNGSVFVTTSLARPAPGKNTMIVISIQDTGAGVPDEVISEIFLPFYTTKKNNAGNGLGLSMVQGFVDQLSGSIKVENNDVGACFHLYLPAHEELSSEETTEFGLPSVQSWEQASSCEKKMLVIVDDNELLLETNVQLVRLQSVPVEGFSNCEDAIKYIESSDDIGCVMIDMKMPQMSGIELADRIENFIDVNHIILYSGNFDKHEIELAGKRGIRKLLRKPLTSTQIFTALKKCMPT